VHRPIAALVPAVVALVLGAGCGGDDEGLDVLPPMRTTTTSSTTTTTVPVDPVYHEVQRGETLSIIANRYQVPLDVIVELNGIVDPDDVPAGQVLELPPGSRPVEPVEVAPGG
jgi:LysM repeat protein